MELETYGFIYETTNKINGKKYIGQHSCFKDNYLGSGVLLKKAILKYGRENFSRAVLEYANSKEELDLLEIEYIAKADAINSKDYYNIHIGGSGGDVWIGKSELEKEEFRKKMSEVTKGEKNGMYGKKHSKETIDLLKKQRAGRRKDYKVFQTDAFREKMSQVTSGEKNGMYGKVGAKAVNGVKVKKFSDPEKTILVEEFNTVRMALSSLGLKGHSQLNNAIANNLEYKGFYWSKEG